MSIEVYLIYLAALAAFFATPPDTSQLLTMSNAMRFGLRRARWTIFGDLSANVLQMSAAAFGLAAVIASSATFFVWVKWLGVAYLAWIGLRLIFSKPANEGSAASGAGAAFALYRQGFVTSMANPFAVVFFAALFPQFIDPAAPVLPQLLILGGTYLLVDFVLLLAWGWAAARSSAWIGRGAAPWINRVSGALMVAAAALLASRDLTPDPAR